MNNWEEILENDPEFQIFLSKVHSYHDEEYEKYCYNKSLTQFDNWQAEYINSQTKETTNE